MDETYREWCGMAFLKPTLEGNFWKNGQAQGFFLHRRMRMISAQVFVLAVRATGDLTQRRSPAPRICAWARLLQVGWRAGPDSIVVTFPLGLPAPLFWW